MGKRWAGFSHGQRRSCRVIADACMPEGCVQLLWHVGHACLMGGGSRCTVHSNLQPHMFAWASGSAPHAGCGMCHFADPSAFHRSRCRRSCMIVMALLFDAPHLLQVLHYALRHNEYVIPCWQERAQALAVATSDKQKVKLVHISRHPTVGRQLCMDSGAKRKVHSYAPAHMACD